MSTQPRSKTFIITSTVVVLLVGLLGAFISWGLQTTSLYKPIAIENFDSTTYSPEVVEFMEIHNSTVGSLQKICPEYNKIAEDYSASLKFASADNNFEALQEKLKDDYNSRISISHEFEAKDCLISNDELQKALADTLSKFGYTYDQTYLEEAELTEGYTAGIIVGPKAKPTEDTETDILLDRYSNVDKAKMQIEVKISVDRFEVSSYTKINNVSASEVPVYLD